MEVAGIRNGDALNVKVLDVSAGSQQQPQPVREQMATTTTTTRLNPPQQVSAQPTELSLSGDISETIEVSGGYLSLRVKVN